MAASKSFQPRKLPVSRFIRKAAGILTTGLSVAASGLGVDSHKQTPTDFISSLHKKVYKRRATHKTNLRQSERQEGKQELDSQSILESRNSNAERVDATEHCEEESMHGTHTRGSNEHVLRNSPRSQERFL